MSRLLRSLPSCVVVALALALLTVVAPPAIAQTTNLEEINSKISELEADVAAYAAMREHFEGLISKAASGKYLILLVDIGGDEANQFPQAVPRSIVEQFLMSEVLAGSFEFSGLEEKVREMVATTRIAARRAQEQARRFEQLERKAKDDLSYYLNERARLRQEKTPSPGRNASSYSGVWDTNSNALTLTVSSDGRLEGTYDWRGPSSVSGVVTGRHFRGTFSQPNHSERRWQSGQAEWTFSDDGNSFSGTFTDADGNPGGSWNGTRRKN